MNWDGSNQRMLPNSPVIRYGTTEGLKVSWSPDGNWLIFTGTIPDLNNEIFLIDINGEQLKYLTNHSASDYAPIWLQP